MKNYLSIISKSNDKSVAFKLHPAVLALIIAIIVAGYIVLVVSAGHARTRLKASVENLRTQAAQMQSDAAELARLRATPITASKLDLRAVLINQATAVGFGRMLANLGVASGDSMEVTLDAVRYADFLSWVANLQAQRVWLQACRIENLPNTGMVRITATFSRSVAQ